MKKWAPFLAAILLIACAPPTETAQPQTKPLDLKKPGVVLDKISIAVPDLPKSLAEKPEEAAASRSIATVTEFDLPAFKGSTYRSVMSELQMNFAQLFLTALKGSDAVNKPDLALGETVDVGSVELGTQTVNPAGKVTTALSEDGQLLSYYWSIPAPTDVPDIPFDFIRVLLQVDKSGKIFCHVGYIDLESDTPFIAKIKGDYDPSTSLNRFSYENPAFAAMVATRQNSNGSFDLWDTTSEMTPGVSGTRVAHGDDKFGGVYFLGTQDDIAFGTVEYYDSRGDLVSSAEGHSPVFSEDNPQPYVMTAVENLMEASGSLNLSSLDFAEVPASVPVRIDRETSATEIYNAGTETWYDISDQDLTQIYWHGEESGAQPGDAIYHLGTWSQDAQYTHRTLFISKQVPAVETFFGTSLVFDRTYALKAMLPLKGAFDGYLVRRETPEGESTPFTVYTYWLENIDADGNDPDTCDGLDGDILLDSSVGFAQASSSFYDPEAGNYEEQNSPQVNGYGSLLPPFFDYSVGAKSSIAATTAKAAALRTEFSGLSLAAYSADFGDVMDAASGIFIALEEE